MADFLTAMARASADRVRRGPDLRGSRRDPLPVSLSPAGFDVIAEVKRVSPSEGALGGTPVERARAYERGGACAISVLTEPTRFAGSLDDLEAVSRAVRLPVMRKDFLVDPVQVREAREAGASGVLLIARILDDDALAAMLAAAAAQSLFVLLEAFDLEDLARIAPFAGTDRLLVGVNARDLTTLRIDPARFARCAQALPPSAPAVAESGLSRESDVGEAVALGYRVALVGTALMRAADPAERLAAWLRHGREVAA